MSVIREFHAIINAGASLAPDQPPLRPDAKLIRSRMRLIREEFNEVFAEMEWLAKNADTASVDAIFARYRLLLKELADLRYVSDGTAVSLGLPIDAAFDAVHESNMSKLSGDTLPPIDKHGKFPKGPYYQPPDMTALVPDIITIQEV